MQQSVFPFLSSMATEALSVGKISMEDLHAFPIIERNFLNYMQTEIPTNILPAEKTVSFTLPMEQTILSSFFLGTIATSYSPLTEDAPHLSLMPTDEIQQLYPMVSQDPQLPKAVFFDKEIIAENTILSSSKDKEDLSFDFSPMLRKTNISSEDISNSDILTTSSDEQFFDVPIEAKVEEDVLYNMPTLYFSKDRKSVFLEDTKTEDNMDVPSPVLPKDDVLFDKENVIDNTTPPSLTSPVSLKDNIFNEKSLPIIKDITLAPDDTKDIISSLAFVPQQETFTEYSTQQKDISLSDDNMMLSTENIFTALQSDILPQKSVSKDNIPVKSMPLQDNNIPLTLLSQEDIKLSVKDSVSSSTNEKDIFSKDSSESKEVREDNPFSDGFTAEKVEFSFIPIQSDIIPKLPVIFESFEKRDILENQKSQFSVNDISLPLLSYKDSLSQEKHGFEHDGMTKAGSDFYNIIKGQDNVSVNKIDMGMRNITEFFKSDNSFIDSKDDITTLQDIVPQNKNRESINQTEIEFLKTDISFIDSKDDTALPQNKNSDAIHQTEAEFLKTDIPFFDSKDDITTLQDIVPQDKNRESINQTEIEFLKTDISFIDSKNDTALPQNKNSDAIYQTEAEFLKTDIPFIDSKNDTALPQNKNSDAIHQTETEFLTKDIPLSDSKNDTALPQNKNSDTIHQTETEFLTKDISLVDSKNVFLLNNDDVTLENVDKNKKDKDFSLNNSVSKSDNLIVTDKVFSTPEKAGDFILNPPTTMNISLPEPHKIKENIISTQIPLEKGIILHVTHFKEKPEQIGINLEPAGFGKAELIIENHDNMVTAIIRSDKMEVLDLIRKEAPSLERHLNNNGLTLSGGGLRFEQGGGQWNHQHQQQHSHSPVLHTALSDQLPLENKVLQNDVSQTLYQKLANITVHGGMDMRL